MIRMTLWNYTSLTDSAPAPLAGGARFAPKWVRQAGFGQARSGDGRPRIRYVQAVKPISAP
jgi:hypothetical protein